MLKPVRSTALCQRILNGGASNERPLWVQVVRCSPQFSAGFRKASTADLQSARALLDELTEPAIAAEK